VPRYVVEKGDTLRSIACEYYQDPRLSLRLAEYNGIVNQNKIRVGYILEIPSKRELLGESTSNSTESGTLVPPHGLAAILETFGDIYEYLREDGTLDPRWEQDQLTRVPLPFALPLSWDRTKQVTQLYCHRKWAHLIPSVFEAIEEEGLRSMVKTFGGCFNFRSKRTGNKLSAHCWGIAIDLNPETNQQGITGDMDPGIVEVFRRFGFKWGGDWAGKSKDPMHFQFCTGY
jgi:D-alanyl-D-alanine carboxypeptidase/LysM domain